MHLQQQLTCRAATWLSCRLSTPQVPVPQVQVPVPPWPPQLLLTSTWLCMTQVSEFVGPQHTALMLLNTWFALVLGFTSDFI